MSSPSHEGGNHLTDADIAAYLDRTLTGTERDRVEDHLAACPECRQHLLETKELLERVRRPRKMLIGGAVAAAAAVVFLVIRPDAGTTDQRALMRDEGTTAYLVAYGPIGAAARNGLRFVWSEAPAAQSYRLTVGRMDAGPIWSSSGTDTVDVLPDSVILRANERYYWVVDALLGDGSTRSTGLREFGVTR